MYLTAFDKGYAARGIVMVNSLLRFCPDVSVMILCLDLESEIACNQMLAGGKTRVMRPAELGTDLLVSIRRDREYREFCWTLGAVLCRHFLREGVEEVIYLDADICFFGNPLIPLEEARGGDVAAVEHRFPARLKKFEKNGVFNVQWVYFRNSETGREAAERWADQCIANCKYDPDNGVVGDQKYLDEWPNLYPTFVSITCLGAGVAPWNHEIMKPRNLSGKWVVGNATELVFYHFHGLRINDDGVIQLSGPVYTEIAELPLVLYMEYIGMIADVERRIRNLTGTRDPSIWRVANTGKIDRIRAALAARIAG